jgi:hypothetical protein
MLPFAYWAFVKSEINSLNYKRCLCIFFFLYNCALSSFVHLFLFMLTEFADFHERKYVSPMDPAPPGYSSSGSYYKHLKSRVLENVAPNSLRVLASYSVYFVMPYYQNGTTISVHTALSILSSPPSLSPIIHTASLHWPHNGAPIFHYIRRILHGTLEITALIR